MIFIGPRYTWKKFLDLSKKYSGGWAGTNSSQRAKIWLWWISNSENPMQRFPNLCLVNLDLYFFQDQTGLGKNHQSNTCTCHKKANKKHKKVMTFSKSVAFISLPRVPKSVPKKVSQKAPQKVLQKSVTNSVKNYNLFQKCHKKCYKKV